MLEVSRERGGVQIEVAEQAAAAVTECDLVYAAYE